MKTSKLILFVGISLIAFNSFGFKSKFLNSATVPAAVGYVHIHTDTNHNYVINVQISNLASSDRLQPPKNSYIVWMETDNGDVKNLGQLKSFSPFLSTKLKAKLQAISTFKPKKIFITAEDDTNVEKPTAEIVLTTPYFENLK